MPTTPLQSFDTSMDTDDIEPCHQQFSMVSGDTDSFTDPGSSRPMDPHKALDCTPGPDTTMVPVDSPSHPNPAGLSSGAALG